MKSNREFMQVVSLMTNKRGEFRKTKINKPSLTIANIKDENLLISSKPLINGTVIKHHSQFVRIISKLNALKTVSVNEYGKIKHCYQYKVLITNTL